MGKTIFIVKKHIKMPFDFFETFQPRGRWMFDVVIILLKAAKKIYEYNTFCEEKDYLRAGFVLSKW